MCQKLLKLEDMPDCIFLCPTLVLSRMNLALKVRGTRTVGTGNNSCNDHHDARLSGDNSSTHLRGMIDHSCVLNTQGPEEVQGGR